MQKAMCLEALAGKRVLILFPHLVVPGGGLNYAKRLAEQLLRRGCRVAILTLRSSGSVSLPDGVEVLDARGPLTSSLWYWLLFPWWQWRLGRLVDAWRPHCLVPQVFPANWWGWLYRKRHPSLPQVWVCQEPSAFIHSRPWIDALTPFWKHWLALLLQPLLASIDCRLARRSDAIVANSRFTAAAVQRIYGIPATAVAWPGVDLERFSPAGVRGEYLLTTAHLTRFKRVDFLLQVFSLMVRKHTSLSLHIVGDGDQRSHLQALARELGLEGRVLFLGSVTGDELLAQYRGARLFIHGAVEEPFGLAPLEAIACGTPVVAHASGGPTEFVTPACGILVDSLDEGTWAAAAEVLLQRFEGDETWRQGVAAAAYPFAWERTLEPLLRVIAETAVGGES